MENSEKLSCQNRPEYFREKKRAVEMDELTVGPYEFKFD